MKKKKQFKVPKYIPLAATSTYAMVIRNERHFQTVVHKGFRKQWVGYGWVTERPAKGIDYKNLRIVVETEEEAKKLNATHGRKTKLQSRVHSRRVSAGHHGTGGAVERRTRH